MIGASKILTVSYGTFSCTLEGFDDPFNTMKAIAEYFRDLAAGDRYFGAEPPTPDAAMLHRIAEREVQRRVEASVQDNGVILRAHDEPPAFAEPAALAAPKPTAPELAAPEPIAPEPAPLAAAFNVPDAAVVTAEAFAEVAAEPQPDIVSARPTLSDMPEGVAARLAKIRAAVAMTEIAPAVAVLSEYAEDQHADEAFATFDTIEDPVVPMISDVSYLSSDDLDDDSVTPDADAEFQAEAVALAAEDDAALTATADETVAEPAEQSYETVTHSDSFEDDYEAEDDLRTALTTDPMAEDANLAETPSLTATSDGDDDLLLRLAEDHADLTADNLAGKPETDMAEDDTMLSDIAGAMADIAAEPRNADTIIFNDDEDLLPAAIFMADEDLTDEDLTDEDLADDATLLTVDVPVLADRPVAFDDGLADDDLAADADLTLLADDEADLTDLARLDAQAASDDAVTFDHADNFDDNLAADENLPADPTPVEAAAADVAATEPDVIAVAPIQDAPAPDAPASDKAQRARARVIRVRRSPDIALIPAAPEPSAADAAQAALSAEAEAELQRELAALEDAATDADEFDAALRAQLTAIGATDDPVTPAAPSAAATLDPTVQDESLRRLMDQTQSEMAEPANRRRLSSIAHLKAAVAATIAERFGTKPKPAEEVEAVRTEPYRNDLARAVRPARPTSTTGQTERPTERPTPLVLVSAQRIDRPAPTLVPVQAPGPVTPVRPRRVSAQQAVAVQQAFDDEDLDLDADEADDTDNIFGDSKGFYEFADRIGATDLPELLEAAAAYSSAVEGRANFTRPQLLRQIAAITGNDVSREDELRGFGALLRNGRIVKVKRGQFALTEASTYLDEARKIAG